MSPLSRLGPACALLLDISNAALAADDAENELSRILDPDPTLQVTSSLSGGRYSLQYGASGSNVSGTTEALELDAITFLTPLHDDGSPYSLQPYLQRTSTLTLDLGGSHFATHNPFGAPACHTSRACKGQPEHSRRCDAARCSSPPSP